MSAKIEEFESDVKDRVMDIAEKVNKKLAIDEEEVVEDFVQEKKSLEDEFPNRNDETLEHQAWIRRKGRWYGELESDLPLLEGMIIGAGDVYDPLSNRKEDAKKLKEEDFEKAVEKGYIDDEGNLLDQYGNRIYNSNKRQMTGFFREVGSDDEPKLFWMNVRGSNANVEPPILEAVRFRAKIADVENGREGFEYLNAPNRGTIEFNKIDSDIFTVDNVLDHEFLKDKFVKLSEIKDLHDSQIGYNQRHITEGDVIYVDRRPNDTTGNMRLAITDDELGDDNYTVWVPEHLHYKIDFETGSKVLVFGFIKENTWNDETTYNIDAWAVHAYDEYKIPVTQTEAQPDDDFTEVYA